MTKTSSSSVASYKQASALRSRSHVIRPRTSCRNNMMMLASSPSFNKHETNDSTYFPSSSQKVNISQETTPHNNNNKKVTLNIDQPSLLGLIRRTVSFDEGEGSTFNATPIPSATAVVDVTPFTPSPMRMLSTEDVPPLSPRFNRMQPRMIQSIFRSQQEQQQQLSELETPAIAVQKTNDSYKTPKATVFRKNLLVPTLTGCSSGTTDNETDNGDDSFLLAPRYIPEHLFLPTDL